MDWLWFFKKRGQKEDRTKIVTIMSEQEIQEIFRWNIPTKEPATETGEQWFGCRHPRCPVSPSGMTAAPGEPPGGSAPVPGLRQAARAQQELIYSAPQQSKLAVLSSGLPC